MFELLKMQTTVSGDLPLSGKNRGLGEFTDIAPSCMSKLSSQGGPKSFQPTLVKTHTEVCVASVPNMGY